jgi:hypothetical protein
LLDIAGLSVPFSFMIRNAAPGLLFRLSGRRPARLSAAAARV